MEELLLQGGLFMMKDRDIEQQSRELLSLAVEGLTALEGSESQGVHGLPKLAESCASVESTSVLVQLLSQSQLAAFDTLAEFRCSSIRLAAH